ncbi:acyltransferase [Pantoea sp. JGM49]|uniref:acyltransferase n=1 Tax=Pantoea sp. JGM49 TaxID=2799791 RepID=UPI001BA59509|nr:acyltransferase [Pantoea sp. JGM49]MBS0881305.1 acyltransferase [Pantoea sp. JGM49]
MVKLNKIENYNDAKGNSVQSKAIYEDCTVVFKGGNNKVHVDDGAKLSNLVIHLDCNNSSVFIGSHDAVSIPLKGTIRVGEDAQVIIGKNVTSSPVYISAVEGAKISIGDDCMISTSVIIRSDDSHPIFDVRTGKRVNPARDVVIGNHVWIGERAVILGGSVVGNGSIVGIGSIVKKKFPNNCIVAGIPAKITRKHIAWERPHLSLTEPYYKNDEAAVKKTGYWDYTDDI